jgi:hypothetical protein
MGLDMYLYAEKFVWTDWDDPEAQKAANRQNPLLADLTGLGIDFDLRAISIQVGYWRKANQIHDWFVNNVQDGEDSCQKSHVSRKQLIELKETCAEVLLLPNTAKDVLPTSDGLFFGNTDYNNEYFDDLRDTIRIVNNCLKLPEKHWDFSYQASW